MKTSGMVITTCAALAAVISSCSAATSRFHATDETLPAQHAVMHFPDLDAKVAALHPNGMLFEKPTAYSAVRNGSRALKDALAQHNVHVSEVTSVLEDICRDTDSPLNDQLYKMAHSSLVYATSAPVHGDALKYVSDQYKGSVLRAMDCPQLVQTVIMQRPTVHLKPADQNTAMEATSFDLNPLGNMVFARDQQITMGGGVVLGRMNSPQRAPEVEVMRLVWEYLGAHIVTRIPEGERLEGGDYFPFGDVELLGVGLRTTRGAAMHLLETKAFTAPTVAVVVDENDKNQDRMHLDTVFNIVSETEAVLESSLIDDSESNPHRRTVDEYTFSKATGKYEINRQGIPFYQYLTKDLAMTVVPVTPDQQLAYMVNFLNLGPVSTPGVNTLLAANSGLGDLLKKAGVNADVQYVELAGIKAMFGAAHCATQVSRAGPRRAEPVGAQAGSDEL